MNSVIKKVKQLYDEAWKDQSKWDRNLSSAIELLKGNLDSNSENTQILICLGAALADFGKHKEALNYLKKAEELGSEDRNLYFNIGVVYMNLDTKNRKKAKSYFKKASSSKQDPETIYAFFDPMAH